ncbi:MAG TPA: acyl-CoA dehydrogenase family protein [Actinomycetota bacterium]|nr:acyl-CoA dehydrogenase family protein [Actinomycetota bacterium]
MAISPPRPESTSTTAQPAPNQPPPLEGYNIYEANRPLVEAVAREGASWHEEQLRELGVIAGGEALEWGAVANENPPVLHTHDRYGNRIDEVEFHPTWHQLLKVSLDYAMHSLPWRESRDGAHAARAAMMITMAEVEAGSGCPVSMTYAAVPALRMQPDVAQDWVPMLTSTEYDPRLVPLSQKTGALCGMAMTEKQGGSDVRANTTTAVPLSSEGGGHPYEITGHKWFCSAPMCDAFLVLAQTDRGLSCFLLPRVLPDGARNAFHIQRLKDKLGNRSNASSEVEFDSAWAVMIGEPGRGVPTIIEMVNHTRLDCILGSTGLMRRATAEAIHHATYRSAFGRRLVEQPLMKNVLADLSIESEAALVTAMRIARSFDESANSEQEKWFRRIATAVSKYWVCKSATWHVAEALECLGGNGYVESSGMPRLYRETPLNSIWEGSGNVNCLDVLRALGREPESFEAWLTEVELAAGQPDLEIYVGELKKELSDDVGTLETRARSIVERMGTALQASLLLRFGDPEVASAFCRSRLRGERGRAYGTLPPDVDFDSIIDRHRAEL